MKTFRFVFPVLFFMCSMPPLQVLGSDSQAPVSEEQRSGEEGNSSSHGDKEGEAPKKTGKVYPVGEVYSGGSASHFPDGEKKRFEGSHAIWLADQIDEGSEKGEEIDFERLAEKFGVSVEEVRGWAELAQRSKDYKKKKWDDVADFFDKGLKSVASDFQADQEMVMVAQGDRLVPISRGHFESILRRINQLGLQEVDGQLVTAAGIAVVGISLYWLASSTTANPVVIGAGVIIILGAAVIGPPADASDFCSLYDTESGLKYFLEDMTFENQMLDVSHCPNLANRVLNLNNHLQ